jgi:thymidylate synthase ThyX
MSESFTEDQRRRIAPFFTNLDRPVFGLKLPQEVAGALFSRYSRSTQTLRHVFLNEFLGSDLAWKPDETEYSAEAIQKARAFYDRVLIGYGDDSVAQLGGAHLACEQVSNLAANLLEDARIGMAPLEKSTRYVRFDQKDAAGEYPFYKEPRIMASSHRDAYLSLMRLLFETYSDQLGPMTDFVANAIPIETLPLRHPQTGEALHYDDLSGDATLSKWAEGAYRTTVRTHVCDLLRGYLPVATLTNLGLFGTGQAFESLLTKLYTHPISEARALATSIHQELNPLIPSFVKRARASDYLAALRQTDRATARAQTLLLPVQSAEEVTLVDHDEQAEEKILAALLYPYAQQPLPQLRQQVREMSPAERKKRLSACWDARTNRRDKPGRAWEQVYYTFDILGNLGAYRDLHRHRILTQERQAFTTIHGYDRPQEIEAAGVGPAFDRCMEAAARLYEQTHRDLPDEAQYVVPFAYRIRWQMKLNLREAVHIAELRSLPQGHSDYRRIVQQMWRKIAEVHPTLADCAKFMDWNHYSLGRLQSEMRTEYKRTIHTT